MRDTCDDMRATQEHGAWVHAGAALRDKYATLVALRVAHGRGLEPPPKSTFVALARRFPGAMQELDRRALADLRERYRQLDAVAQGRASLPGWARLHGHYHGITRVALGLKLAMAKVASAEAEPNDAAARVWLAKRVAAGQAEADEPVPAFWIPERLAWLRKPPGGRLSRLTADWAAVEAGWSSAAARAELFPAVTS